jgi:periplasmic protein TonB
MSEQIEATRSPKVPTSGHKESFALLNSCLVDGDAEQRSRERQGRRRALAISVGLQSTALLALLIIPLIGRTERITLGTFTPIPPYKHYRGDTQTPLRPSGGPRAVCQFCYSPIISPTIPTRDPNRTGEVTGPIIGVGPIGSQDNPHGIQIPDSRPTRPLEEVRREPQTQRIHVGHLEPAMLVRRIEPQYPTLAKQTGHTGRVELHAIIAADGSIQSLEVVDGDPMFVRSALDAVSQWRYKPTLLNGLPVEVDTHITVIYSMQR